MSPCDFYHVEQANEEMHRIWAESMRNDQPQLSDDPADDLTALDPDRALCCSVCGG